MSKVNVEFLVYALKLCFNRTSFLTIMIFKDPITLDLKRLKRCMLRRISRDHYYNSRFFLIVQVQPIEPYVYAKISTYALCRINLWQSKEKEITRS